MKGKLVYLRAPEPEDVDFIFDIENNTNFWKASDTLIPFSRFEIETFIFENKHDIFTEKQLRLIICSLFDEKPLGIIDLFDYQPNHKRAGVGIIISENQQEKGFAKDALSVLEDYAKNILALNQLYCHIHSNNLKSIHLFEGNDFGLQGKLLQWEFHDGKFEDVLIYQRLFN